MLCVKHTPVDRRMGHLLGHVWHSQEVCERLSMADQVSCCINRSLSDKYCDLPDQVLFVVLTRAIGVLQVFRIISPPQDPYV